MENQQQHQTLPYEASGSSTIGQVPIGRNKYKFLKSKKIEDLTDFENKQILDFENKNQPLSETQKKAIENYSKSLKAPESKLQFSITAKELWELFKINFQQVNAGPLILIEGVSIKNFEPLIYYFAKDKRFFECENLSKLSVPSFEKGLLIIGNFGNGKTAAMKTFEKIFKGIPEYGFKGFSANEVVTMFEKCGKDVDKEDFERLTWKGIRYFDDLKTERTASNFGKVNIFKEILEERYTRKSKTYATCNFKEGFKDNIEQAVNEFVDKYGERVYDRLFEMFNIVYFKGESFRK